jgi:hypothetical protein
MGNPNPTFGFDEGFGDGFDPKGFDDKISGFDGAINTSVVEEFFGVTPEAPPEHEDKLIKDGNDLIQKHLEDRKKSREYGRQQTTKDRPQVETKVSMSFVDWSGFPDGAIHSPAIASERKPGTTFSRRASLTNGGAVKDEDQRRAVLLKTQRRSSVGATTTSIPEEELQGLPKKDEPKFRNRRSSLRGGGSGSTHPPAEKQDPQQPQQPRPRCARRLSLDQGGSHHRAERRASRRPPPEDKEGTHPRVELAGSGSAKGNRTEKTGSGKGSRGPRRIQSIGAEPVSPPARVRRPVQAAASSTTFEVNRKAPHRTTSGIRRPDRKGDLDPAARNSLELRNKGMLQKAPSIRSMQW